LLGYERQFIQLRHFLSEQSFADKIQVVGIKDSGFTGNFVSQETRIKTYHHVALWNEGGYISSITSVWFG
jgi:hypothetical protein